MTALPNHTEKEIVPLKNNRLYVAASGPLGRKQELHNGKKNMNTINKKFFLIFILQLSSIFKFKCSMANSKWPYEVQSLFLLFQMEQIFLGQRADSVYISTDTG